MLVDAGFLVTAADASLHMIKHSKHAWEMACREQPERRDKAEFVAQDIMRTTFAAGSFDAVVCNRLFHHYREPALRRAALAELRRISSGPLVVFYFDRFALDTIRLAGLRAIFGKFVNDRFPIPGKRFAAEAATVGLRLEKVIWKRWGISPQAYAVFRLSGDCRNATTTDIAAHRWPHILT
jgi:SAM-dependent methyltransferase